MKGNHHFHISHLLIENQDERESRVTKPSAWSATLLDGGNGLLGGVVEVVGRQDVEAALGEHLVAEVDVRASKTHDEREGELDLAARRDDAARDRVALDDAAKDVDEDRLLLRSRDNLAHTRIVVHPKT